MDNATAKQRLLSDFFIRYPKGLALYDAQGLLIEINKAMYKKYSVTNKNEFLLNNLFETEFLSELQKEHLQCGRVIHSEIPFDFTVFPGYDSEGKRIGYTLLITSDTYKENDQVSYSMKMQELVDMTEKMAESVPDTILLINEKLKIERVITYAAETCITPAALGCRVDEIPGFIYPEATKRMMVKMVQKCLDKSEVLNLDFSLPGHEAPVVYFQLRMVPMHHKYVVAYIHNVSNIKEKESENKSLSEQLSRNTTMMELALRHSKISTYSFNFKRFLSCDKINCNHCFQFYGTTNTLLERNKYICRSLSVLRHPEDRNDFFFLFNEMRNRKLDEFSTEFRLKNNDGLYRNYEVLGKTLELDSQGIPFFIVGCVIDNQDQIEIRDSLIKAKEKAENADLLKSTFLANMTHEIRTPLNAIVGFSDLLGVETDPELREMYSGLIRSNNELLLRLVNDVLDISKIESGMMTFNNKDVDLLLLMKEEYNTMKLKASEKVSLVLNECPAFTYNTDKSRLSQILINLLTNAFKYTTEGFVHFGYQWRGKDILFYVSDTGKGICKQEQERIFDRFVQLNGHVQGVGLGLSICKGLVTKMGGKIEVSSQEGKGAVFSFTLPLGGH